MKYSMKMVLEYAKVFEENYDKGDADGNSAAKSVAKKGGQTVVNAYFTDQSDIDKLLADGLEPKPLGYDRIVSGNDTLGIGQFIKMKRDYKPNVHTFQNQNGPVTIDFGGLPKVVDLRDMDNKRLWDVAEDGYLGNGTVAQVMFETYSNGSGVRLVAIGVEDLVPWEDKEKNYDESLFEVN